MCVERLASIGTLDFLGGGSGRYAENVVQIIRAERGGRCRCCCQKQQETKANQAENRPHDVDVEPLGVFVVPYFAKKMKGTCSCFSSQWRKS